MVITEVNLEELTRQYGIAPGACCDQFSITLHLSKVIRRYKFSEDQVVTYGNNITEENVQTLEIEQGYVLKPGQAILACTKEEINMPLGYMGFLQTKGSLARLFVTSHCCDGQVEPGFNGHVTLEICNIGSLNVKLMPGCAVAQMFIFKTSSDKQKYEGRYNQSAQPTYSKPEQ